MACSWVKFLPHDFSMNATLRERILWGGFFGPKGGIFQIQVSHGADDEFMIQRILVPSKGTIWVFPKIGVPQNGWFTHEKRY